MLRLAVCVIFLSLSLECPAQEIRAFWADGFADGFKSPEQVDLLLKRLRKAEKVGFIRSATSIGYPLRFARKIDLPGGGSRILLATDRPVGFLEATSSSRRNDYPFLLIDIRLDANGKGEGKLLNFARVNWADEGTIEVENWDREPVRLTQVHLQK